MSTNVYTVIAYPKGARKVVATLHGLDTNSEYRVKLAASIAGVSPGSEADAMVNRATRLAGLGGSTYVDLERNGDHIATVGPEGPV